MAAGTSEKHTLDKPSFPEYNGGISTTMACPFFMPTAKCEDGAWIHPARLPLGAGWLGRCCAPGHEDSEPSGEEIRELCNLGYANSCSRLPRERAADAVRFSVSRDGGGHLTICFVCELGHGPAGHGLLEYDVVSQTWLAVHPDGRIQKMAECYIDSYLARRSPSGIASSHSSPI